MEDGVKSVVVCLQPWTAVQMRGLTAGAERSVQRSLCGVCSPNLGRVDQSCVGGLNTQRLFWPQSYNLCLVTFQAFRLAFEFW